MVSKIMANKQDRRIRDIESYIINNMAKRMAVDLDKECLEYFLEYFKEEYIRNEGWYTLKELVKEYSNEQKPKQ